MSKKDPNAKPLPAYLMLGRSGVDERRRPVLRYKDLARDYAADVGGRPSTAQWALISRAAGLQVLAELQEATMAEGGEVNVEKYTKLVNSLVTVLRTIGLARRANDITPKAEAVEGHAATIGELAEEDGS